MVRARASYRCGVCEQMSQRWSGRCSGCGSWGSVADVTAAPGTRRAGSARTPEPLGPPALPEARVETLPGLDRILGGGLVAGSVVLLAGEPGIGKSTLLLQVLGAAPDGTGVLLASGEESRAQVATRAGRLGLAPERVSFMPGRDLGDVVETAGSHRPAILAVDSIQTIRDVAGQHVAGGVAQVRASADALVGLAKETGIAVVATGHVTKDGDLAGPRALEHAVDVVLSFEGDARSGLRVLSGGKNRFGPEGESAWFEMGAAGLTEIDPTGLFVTGEVSSGAAVGLPKAGRRALAVEIQALVGPPEGPARRQVTGLDARRFSMVAAVMERSGVALARAELYGATAGGVRVDDPACDLAIALALASAAEGVPVRPGSAFVGEVALTGQVRGSSGMESRLAAAGAAGIRVVLAPPGAEKARPGMEVVTVHHVREALRIGLLPAETPFQRLLA